MPWVEEGQENGAGGTNQQDVVDNQKAIAENNELIVDNGGRLDSVEASVSTLNGVVDSDGVPYANVKNVPFATGTTAGVVRPDNITIRSANGVLTVDVAAAEKRAVSTEAFMLGLPLIQNLYIVTRSDVNRIFYLNAGEDPATLSNWIQGASTLDAVSSFNGRNGAVLPNTGDYAVSDITDLQDTLEDKQDTIDATNRLPVPLVGDGSVTDVDFSHLAGVNSNIQDQLDASVTDLEVTSIVDSKVDPVSARVTNLESDKVLPLIDQFYKHAVPEMSPVYSNGRIQWDNGRILFLWMVSDDMPSGHFNIRMPVEGTVIPYLSDPGRVGETVTSGGILLTQYYTLWYTLPFGQTHRSLSVNFFYTYYDDDEVSIPAGAVRVATGLGTGDVYITSVGVVSAS